MRIEIKFPAKTDRHYKRQQLFEQTLLFIERYKSIKRENWNEGVKIGDAVSACLLELKTKGTLATIEFDEKTDLSHLYCA